MTEAERTAALKNYAGEDRVLPSAQLRASAEKSAPHLVRFLTGIDPLDFLVKGFEGGELIAISGVTKHGKTTLAQTMTINAMKQGIYSLWFSFEVPLRQFMSQMPAECEFFSPALLVPHRPSWLDDRIVESKLKYNTRLVVVDHLHYLIDLERRGSNMSVDIGAIVRGLKRTAIKHNVVVLLLCHATKAQGPTGEPRELGAMDLRDSSFTASEADSTWIIQRRKDKSTDEYNDRATLKVCNHRRTGVMEKKVILKKIGLVLVDANTATEAEGEKEPTFYADTLDGGQGNDSLPY